MVDLLVYGDTENSIGDRTLAGDQALGAGIQIPYTLVQIFGDADALRDRAQGGDDVFTQERGNKIELFGDARLLADRSQGGDDTVKRFDGADIFIFGDAEEMVDRAQGGDDVLQAGYRSGARARSTTKVYGDAETLKDRSEGGDDVLIGHSYYFSASRLYGDGRALLDDSKGGDDTIISGGFGSPDDMWGDAVCVSSKTHTGADTFKFNLDNGRDIIHDFEIGKDTLDFSGFAPYGLDDFESLSSRIIHQADGTLIILDFYGLARSSSVLLVGVQNLSESDIFFG
jgi:hypothetical protein